MFGIYVRFYIEHFHCLGFFNGVMYSYLYHRSLTCLALQAFYLSRLSECFCFTMACHSDSCGPSDDFLYFQRFWRMPLVRFEVVNPVLLILILEWFLPSWAGYITQNSIICNIVHWRNVSSSKNHKKNEIHAAWCNLHFPTSMWYTTLLPHSLSIFMMQLMLYFYILTYFHNWELNIFWRQQTIFKKWA